MAADETPDATGPGSMLRLSALELDDLLDELRDRAGSARAAQERLSALLDAVVAVSSDLELPTVLRRIVESACHLVGARYGALGVLGPEGDQLVEFVTYGVSEEERERIGPLPHGRGLLGLLIHSPHPQRVADIHEHPESYGFPENHPLMTSFLGTPIRIRNEVFGNLYMTDKLSGTEFTADDEVILTALAAAAGVAIDNARLYNRSVTQQRWGEATRDLVSALLQGRAQGDVLANAVHHVLELTDATSCAIAVPRGSDLVVAAAAGEGAPQVGTVVHDQDWLAELASPSRGVHEAEGGLVLVSLGAGGEPLGVLAVRDMTTVNGFTAPLLDFGQRLGVGLTAAQAQEERGRIDLLEDRDRIARDMHDHVIQRLFATGLSLQSLGRQLTDAAARERVEAAVDEVDAVIKDIRHTIFALHRSPDSRSLASEVTTLCENAVVTLGFAPSLTVRGTLADVPEQLAADLLAVVREALSNAARHAGASVVSVLVDAADQLRVEVRDNGRGVQPGTRRSGLDNLARRATTRGGQLVIGVPAEGGTELVWSVPLEKA
ncbi:two-component system sensor histidine kinase [Phycicoccus ginsengisoli]